MFDWDALERAIDEYIQQTPSEQFFADLRALGVEVVDFEWTPSEPGETFAMEEPTAYAVAIAGQPYSFSPADTVAYGSQLHLELAA